MTDVKTRPPFPGIRDLSSLIYLSFPFLLSILLSRACTFSSLACLSLPPTLARILSASLSFSLFGFIHPTSFLETIYKSRGKILTVSPGVWDHSSSSSPPSLAAADAAVYADALAHLASAPVSVSTLFRALLFVSYLLHYCGGSLLFLTFLNALDCVSWIWRFPRQNVNI